MKQFMYILTGALLLSACSRSSFETESKATVDSLLLAYQALEVEIEEMPSEKVQAYFKEYKTFFAATQKEVANIKVDDLRDLSFMDSFKSVKKGFKKFPAKQKKYQKDLEGKVKELHHLLNDINNDVFDKKTLKKYLKEEREAFEKLQKKYEKSMQTVREQRIVLDSLKVTIPQKIELLR